MQRTDAMQPLKNFRHSLAILKTAGPGVGEWQRHTDNAPEVFNCGKYSFGRLKLVRIEIIRDGQTVYDPNRKVKGLS